MNAVRLEVPEYGDAGDYIGTRRSRRSFRWLVAGVVLFTAMLWLTERYFRYDYAERLYLTALTLEPEHGQKLLRQAVRHAETTGNESLAKYLEALAQREDADQVLRTYERAYRADPHNPYLAMRYGCRLLEDGQPANARSKFREASENLPSNPLPLYLEAAAIPWIDNQVDDLSTSLAAVIRGNNTTDHATFPEPLWSPELPEHGFWHMKLRRDEIDRCAKPICRYVDLVTSKAEQAVNERKIGNWADDLRTIRQMGEHIARGSLDYSADGSPSLKGGAAQAYLGLYALAKAQRQLERIARLEAGEEVNEVASQSERIEDGLRGIEAFESRRSNIIHGERAKYGFPLANLAAATGVLLAFQIVSYVLCKMAGVNSTAHNVPHSRLARAAFAGWAGVLFLLLLLITVMQRSSQGQLPFEEGLRVVWWGATQACVVLGVLGPAFTLARPATLRIETVTDDEKKKVRKMYRAAYLSLVRRYLGIQFGLTLVAACVWAVGFRIFFSVYPWQVKLLATGLEREEIEVIRGALTLLN